VKLISAFVIGMSVLMSAILVVLPEKEGDYECMEEVNGDYGAKD